MKKSNSNYFTVIFGFLLLCLGLYLMRTNIEAQGFMRILPFVFVGVGSGIWGHGMGELISQKALKKNPDLEKKIEIEKNDERNIVIGNLAKAKAYDMMIYLFAVLMIVFTLMGINLTAILLLVFAYLFVIGYGIYYRYKFDKEM